MTIDESMSLMRDIRAAQKNPKTPVGAAYSLQEYLGRHGGIATIGPCLPDGRYALYATSTDKKLPKEWCGFPVINTDDFKWDRKNKI